MILWFCIYVYIMLIKEHLFEVNIDAYCKPKFKKMQIKNIKLRLLIKSISNVLDESEWV